jgi:hypothetical protein
VFAEYQVLIGIGGLNSGALGDTAGLNVLEHPAVTFGRIRIHLAMKSFEKSPVAVSLAVAELLTL